MAVRSGRHCGRVAVFVIEPAQIRGPADIADDHDRSVRALGPYRDGEAIDEGQEIHEQEA